MNTTHNHGYTFAMTYRRHLHLYDIRHLTSSTNGFNRYTEALNTNTIISHHIPSTVPTLYRKMKATAANSINPHMSIVRIVILSIMTCIMKDVGYICFFYKMR